MRRTTGPHEKIIFVMLLSKSGSSVILLAVFAAIYLPARAASPSAEADDVKAGAVLYRDKGCEHCHGPALEGTPKGPALANIQNDKAWPPETITDHILDGGKKMPPFRESLTDDEIAQMVAFLRSNNRPIPTKISNDSSAPQAPTPKN